LCPAPPQAPHFTFFDEVIEVKQLVEGFGIVCNAWVGGDDGRSVMVKGLTDPQTSQIPFVKSFSKVHVEHLHRFVSTLASTFVVVVVALV
jgi:hypothetical protein